MTKEELDEWFIYYTQYKNGYHLSDFDYKELIRLNHLIMEASHDIHNDHMLAKKEPTTEIAIKWCIEDVKDLDDTLTDEQCAEVLEAVKRNHDATIGVTWDTLEYYIDVIKNK